MSRGSRVFVQELYMGVPVPDALREGDMAGNFAFLEKELKLSS